MREATGQGLDAGAGGQEPRIDTTLAGRAFRDGQSHSAPVDGRVQHWLPVLDGTERLGVLRVETDAEPDEQTQATMEDLASLVGLLLISKRHHSDSHEPPHPCQPDVGVRGDAVDADAAADVREGE